MIKKEGDKWIVDTKPGGRTGRRYRKVFNTRKEAKQFNDFVSGLANKGEEWIPKEKDKRKLSDLINEWYAYKGADLSDGERRKNILIEMAEINDDPIGYMFDSNAWVEYKSVVRSLDNPPSKKTLNNRLGYLRAMYNFLIKTKRINYPNPLSDSEMIRLDESELSYLKKEHIRRLMDAIDEKTKNPHVKLISRICLSTGARWSEAENLKSWHINDGKLTFSKTKGKKSRTVPVEDKLFEEIKDHFRRYGGFTSSLCAFDRALRRSKIELPRGQSSHVLRHTFASWFMMNGGNILVLQKILGHSTITLTMRYAHLSPDHLSQALQYNPLANL